jgi:uncharacterized membrane protein YeaQ/YmgE (transglycosylase-associated protein family)
MLSFLVFLVFGLVVGAVARLIMPGREPGGWVVSLVLGVAGAMIGGFVGRMIGLYEPHETAGFIVSLLAAIGILAVYNGLRRRRAAV